MEAGSQREQLKKQSKCKDLPALHASNVQRLLRLFKNFAGVYCEFQVKGII